MTAAVTVRRTGKAEFARLEGAPPAWWEGLAGHGQAGKLKAGAKIKDWIKAAGMDWKIQRAYARYYVDKNGKDLRTWDNRCILFRSDTKAPLGFGSPEFNIVQPQEVLEFFRDLTEAAGFKLITAGTLHGGTKFWAQADIGESAIVVPGDRVNGRLLFATACDGSMNSIFRDCAERVVCANTLAIAMGEKGRREVRVSHRSKLDPVKVKAELGIAVGAFQKFMAQARELSKRQISKQAAELLTTTILAPAGTVLEACPREEVQKIQESSGYRKILELFNGTGRGASLKGVQGTAWGWVNAVSEYVDHHTRARSEDNRINTALFGSGDELKNDALEHALVLVK